MSKIEEQGITNVKPLLDFYEKLDNTEVKKDVD